jgi:hypothetical protein
MPKFMGFERRTHKEQERCCVVPTIFISLLAEFPNFNSAEFSQQNFIAINTLLTRR